MKQLDPAERDREVLLKNSVKDNVFIHYYTVDGNSF